MATKREVCGIIKSVIEGLTYHPDIHWPNYASINIGKCLEITPHFKSDLVTEWTVNHTIYDTVRVIAQAQNRHPLTQPEITKAVTDIYAYLKSLPRKYLFLFPLPDGEIQDKELARNVEIKKVSQAFSETLASQPAVQENATGLRHLLGDALNGLSQPIIKAGTNVLELKSTGYVNNLSTTRLYGSDPLFTFKVIMGAYIASSAFDNNSQQRNNPYGIASSYTFYGFDNVNGLEFLRRFEESSDDQKLLEKFVFKESSVNYDWTNDALVKLFSSQRLTFIKNIQAQLKNGLYWYFEASKSNLSHFQAVFIVSALDSFFLKDDNAAHKADLISAAIADNFNWESQIKKNVPQLYKLRNDIVHGQKAIGVYNQTAEDQALEDFLIFKCRAILRQFLAFRLKSFHDMS